MLRKRNLNGASGMTATNPWSQGTVHSLCLNGSAVETIHFDHEGPRGDSHYGFTRTLSGHDSQYLKTSNLAKGDSVFNWRSWTGLSLEEIRKVEEGLGCNIPSGCLLENLIFEGIPIFSHLPNTSRLVFPKREGSQAILAIWGQNEPCSKVGKRLQDLHPDRPNLATNFVTAAQQRRGVMGFVISAGIVHLGDQVDVYLPA